MNAPPTASRLVSLDAFRGATIAAMLLVNNPGTWSELYPPLKHAEWHGWTFTDTVFPFFLWIVGVAIPLSFAKRLAQGARRAELFRHVLIRAAIIFALGLFLSSFGSLIDGSLAKKGLGTWLADWFANVRILGVLQRIALCYLAASAIYLTTRLRGQIVWTVGLLIGYWLVMRCVPVPGGGVGVFDEKGNLSQWLDQAVLGAHCYKGTKFYDPEGLLSTLPALATCLLGIFTGEWLRTERTPAEKVAWLLVAGNLLLFAGALMDLAFPINKKIWTSSFSVFMAGLAMNCFGVCYWLIDVQGWGGWARPFVIFGMNAIAMFVLAGVIGRAIMEISVPLADGQSLALRTWLWDRLFLALTRGETPWCSVKFVSLLYALSFVSVFFLIAWGMYRRKWFIKV
jgi:predicted acyltransferase